MTLTKLKAPVGTQILTHPNHHISLYRIMPSAPSPLAKYHQSLEEVLTLKQLFMAWYATACSTINSCLTCWKACPKADKSSMSYLYGSVRYVGTSPRSSIFVHFLETLISLIWGICNYTHCGEAARVFHCIETLPLEQTRRDTKLKQLVEISWDTLSINVFLLGPSKIYKKDSQNHSCWSFLTTYALAEFFCDLPPIHVIIYSHTKCQNSNERKWKTWPQWTNKTEANLNFDLIWGLGA